MEFLFPYEYAPDEVESRAKAADTEVVLFNMPGGNWGAGERGLAGVPRCEQEFREGVEKAPVYAERLGPRRLHAMAGIAPAGADHAACRATLVENLKYAAEKLASKDITVLLEAINTLDMPSFIVSTQKESHSICEEVGAPNLKMQMDIYHMQVMEGDLATCLKRYASQCGHIQVAGYPERHEPDTGEVRYEYLFLVLDEIGHAGWLGCEYRPAGKTTDGLLWLSAATR